MALTKNTVIDRIEIVGIGAVVVNTKVVVLDGGVEIASSSKQHTIFPGDDYSAEDARVQAICEATHTAEVVAAYQAAQAAVAQ